MSLVVVTGADIARRPAKPFWRPATIITAIAWTAILLFLALHVIDSGYLRADVEALRQGEAWKTGGWLSQAVLRVVGLLPGLDLQQLVLSLVAAGATGLMFGVLYDRLRQNGWFAIGATLLLVAFALHAGELYALTASSRAIPIYIAFAALIPAIRMLEDIGDVQSAIALGLLLPLLLLASPVAAPLILPLAVAAALANPDARRDGRAFVAMMLVAVLPTIIVALGIIGFIAQARLNIGMALLPYLITYTDIHFADIEGSLLALVAFAPVMVVPLMYCVWPDLPERRHVWSALAVVALPLYLALARQTLTTPMTPIVPPVALIAAFVSWLAVVRLPFPLRLLALVMMALSALLSWAVPVLWDDPAWRTALFSSPAPFSP